MACGLPPFTADGVLPPADYPLTLDALRASHLVTGEGALPATWDAAWREHLVGNLAVVVRQLWQVGIGRIHMEDTHDPQRV